MSEQLFLKNYRFVKKNELVTSYDNNCEFIIKKSTTYLIKKGLCSNVVLVTVAMFKPS